MKTKKPITDITRKRHSCRTYSTRPVEKDLKERLEQFLSDSPAGPFGSRPRFKLITTTGEDRDALKDLGTYGFIKDPAGYILSAVKQSPRDLEDFGYTMERNILYATDLGLGTCWLGGSFTRSTFAEKIRASNDETLPAVASVGHMAPKMRIMEKALRWGAGAENRKPWKDLFFNNGFNGPLSPEDIGKWAEPLEMVRIAPSASNRQPWRIVRESATMRFHFYLQRTKGYQTRNKMLFGMADLQRVDMGIAMCHFEMTCNDSGISGKWSFDEPDIGTLPELTAYVASWQPSL
ncbi:MAG: nitroreductase [Deltaproteobacteria bacterium]|nr:nitroreductase [Deltaproteobacteria bacterium]